MKLVCPCCQHQFQHDTLEQRLWNQISKSEDPHGCWEWIGSLNKKGYGVGGTVQGYGYITLGAGKKKKGQKFYAHRLVYALANGPIPDGLFVCHKCDNPCCCNPDHLFLGTNQQNMDDMIRKNRSPRRSGENSTNAKLTSLQVQHIRYENERGVLQKVLAKQYGVSLTTISRIIQRKTWKEVA